MLGWVGLEKGNIEEEGEILVSLIGVYKYYVCLQELAEDAAVVEVMILK